MPVSCSVLEPSQIANSTGAGPIPILFIIDQLCELGGAEKALLRTINRLPGDRYAPLLVTFKIDESLGFRRSVSCPLYVFPLRRTYDWQAVKVACSLRSLIRGHRVQITHTFHETADLWAAPIAKLSGCPILISSRRDMGFNREPKHTRPYRWMGHYFSQVQTVSEQVRRHNIEKDRLDPSRVITIYNGIDLQPEYPAENKTAFRKRFGLAHAAHLVTSVGHIRAIKGFDVFLKTAARVREAVPNAVFAIAGDDHEPEHTQHLKQMAAAEGFGCNFVFLGPVDDVRPLLRASDVFCLLSRSEGLSNALLEAMACELPCVVTRVGGNPEVVCDGSTGYIVESENADSAAAAVVQLLSSPETARFMGAAGRRRVEQKFTTEIMMRNLTDSYEHLLDAARGKRS